MPDFFTKNIYLHLLVIAMTGLIAYSNSFTVPFQFDDRVIITGNPLIRDIRNVTSPGTGPVNNPRYEYNTRRFVGYVTLALNYRWGELDVTGYHVVNLLIHLINAILVYFFVLLTFRTPYFTASEKLKVKGEKLEDRLMPSLVKPHTSPSPSSPTLKGGEILKSTSAKGEILQPSPPEGEGEGEGAFLNNSLVSHDSRSVVDDSRSVVDDSRFTIHPPRRTRLGRAIHDSRFVALFAALLFVTHPVQTQAVTYIVQRFTSLAALFYLLSMVMYIKGRQIITEVKVKKDSSSNLRPHSSASALALTCFILSLLSAVCAMKTKEIAFTLPIMILLYEFTFFRSSLKRKLLFLLPVLLTLVIIPLSMLHIDKPLGELLSDLSARTRLDTDIARGDYLMTEMRVIVTYIRLLFLPVNQNVDYDYPISRSFFTPSVLLSFLFLSALFGTAVYLLYKSRQAGKPASPSRVSSTQGRSDWQADKLIIDNSQFTIDELAKSRHTREGGYPETLHPPKKTGFPTKDFGNDELNRTFHDSSASADPPGAGDSRCVVDDSRVTSHVSRLCAFGILWFFLALSVESSFIPIVDVIFEHRLYLPSIGAFIALSAALYAAASQAGKRWPLAEKAVIPLALIMVMALAGATFARNRVWQDELGLWQDVAKKSAGSPRAHNNLGFFYNARGMNDQAIEQFVSALRLKPDYLDARINLGIAYNAKGMFDKAIEQLIIALSMRPDNADAYNNLGIALVSKGMPDEGITHYKTALRLQPDYTEVYNNLGVAYGSKGLFDQARENFEQAIRLKPDYFEAYYNLALVYEKTGDYEKSAALKSKAKEITPAYRY